MIPKSGNRFSGMIMREEKPGMIPDTPSLPNAARANSVAAEPELLVRKLR